MVYDQLISLESENTLVTANSAYKVSPKIKYALESRPSTQRLGGLEQKKGSSHTHHSDGPNYNRPYLLLLPAP